MIALEIPQQYTLPVSRPDWALLLADWAPLLPEGITPWLLTKFGELFVSQRDGKVGMLQASCFAYQVVARDKTAFREWLADPDKMSEWFLAPLVDRLESAGKVLSSDQCYHFVQPLGLGGAACLENVAMLSIQSHFCGLGKLFRQVGGLPPGTQIIAKQP